MKNFVLLIFVLLHSLFANGATEAEQPGSPSPLRIAVYESELNAAEYHGIHQAPLRAWLQRNRYEFEVIGSSGTRRPIGRTSRSFSRKLSGAA